MTKKSTKDVVWGWLEKGNHDLKSAEILLKSNDEDVMDMACYHCHQAVEKYLKSFLVSKKISLSKTHDLDYLFKLCIKEELSLLSVQAHLNVLLELSSDVRYPADGASYSLEEAQRAIIAAQEIIKFIHPLLISV